MTKLFKIVGYLLLVVLLIALLTGLFFFVKWNRATAANMELLGEAAPTLSENNYQFRDLNKNGRLDVYEDGRAVMDTRIADLTKQMTVEEKAGLLFITMIGMKEDGALQESPVPNEPITFF